MAAQTITVYIDTKQLAVQKANNNSLYLAKMVNGQFTVIWQARGPAAYGYQNTFQIAVPSYQLNVGLVRTLDAPVTFEAVAIATNINIGQTVVLQDSATFRQPTNNSFPNNNASEKITIFNQLGGSPRIILFDNMGNPIFVDPQNGMELGLTILEPVDRYQIWFGPPQAADTFIAPKIANATIVSFPFPDRFTSQVVSLTAVGVWQQGPLGADDQAPPAGQREP